MSHLLTRFYENFQLTLLVALSTNDGTFGNARAVAPGPARLDRDLIRGVGSRRIEALHHCAPNQEQIDQWSMLFLLSHHRGSFFLTLMRFHEHYWRSPTLLAAHNHFS